MTRFSIKMKQYLSSMFLLDKILGDASVEFDIAMLDDDPYQDYAPILETMVIQSYLDMDTKNNKFFVTEQGKALHKHFINIFKEYVEFYYIFAFVDLEKGEFAFAESNNMNDDEWEKYIDNPRWEDLRLTMLRYDLLADNKSEEEIRKTSLEMVFCARLDEGAFEKNSDTFAFDVYSGEFLNDSIKVVDNHLKHEKLSYTNEEGEFISCEDVMEDMIEMAEEVLNTLED